MSPLKNGATIVSGLEASFEGRAASPGLTVVSEDAAVDDPVTAGLVSSSPDAAEDADDTELIELIELKLDEDGSGEVTTAAAGLLEKAAAGLRKLVRIDNNKQLTLDVRAERKCVVDIQPGVACPERGPA